MTKPVLTISSKNYSSWSLRGWLLCKMAGLKFDERISSIDDPGTRAELLLLSPSFLVPCLSHNGVSIWDTLAIAEYLAEIKPRAGLLPKDRAMRAHCRASGCPVFAAGLAWCFRTTSCCSTAACSTTCRSSEVPASCGPAGTPSRYTWRTSTGSSAQRSSPE